MPENFPPQLRSFLDHLKFQKRYSQHTLTAYHSDLSAFHAFISTSYGQLEPDAITSSMVRTWLASLNEAGIEAKSLNRKISALKSYFKFQLKEGSIVNSPMVNIISPKIKKRLPQFVDERDVADLFKLIEFPDDWEGRTHHLILSLFYNTGIRQAELLSLKESHIDIGNRVIKVLGKGNKERVIPVSKQLIDSLQQYIAQKKNEFGQSDMEVVLVNKQGKKLYPKYVYNIVNKYLAKVTSIKKKSPHVLRHTFATHLLNEGAELNAVKELLGHSSLASTQVYTHNTIEKLKDVYKKAHPKA